MDGPLILEPDVGVVREALHGRPVVVASECVVAPATLPWLAEAHPDARVRWLDAHPDFNFAGIRDGALGAGPRPPEVHAAVIEPLL